MKKGKYQNLMTAIRQTINPDLEEEIAYLAEKRNLSKQEIREKMQQGKLSYTALIRYNRLQGKRDENSIEQLSQEEMDWYRTIVILVSNIDTKVENTLTCKNTFLTDEIWENIIEEVKTYPPYTSLEGRIVKKEKELKVEIAKIPPKADWIKLQDSCQKQKEKESEEKKKQERLKQKRKEALQEIQQNKKVKLVLQYGIKENGKIQDYPLKEVILFPEEEEIEQ